MRLIFVHVVRRGSLAVWIGDVDENVWWMWLKKAREDVGGDRG